MVDEGSLKDTTTAAEEYWAMFPEGFSQIDVHPQGDLGGFLHEPKEKISLNAFPSKPTI